MILISNTESKFIDNVMIVLYQDKIPYQIIDLDNIYMEYDIHKPKKIFASHKDLSRNSVIEFVKEYTDIVVNTKEDLVQNAETQSHQKNNKIALFLDGVKELPQNLKDILFPKKYLPIHIFNCYIKHPQNAGLLNETEKIEIIKTYTGLISFEDRYKAECEINGTFYGNASEIAESDILGWLKNTITPKSVNVKTYRKYIQEILYE